MFIMPRGFNYFVIFRHFLSNNLFYDDLTFAKQCQEKGKHIKIPINKHQR